MIHSSHHFSIKFLVTIAYSFNCAVSLSASSSASRVAELIENLPNFPPPFSLVSANPSVFLDDNLRFRSFICLAADAHIDRHNAFMISGDSCLHMLLDRDTFTSLGLTGAACKFDEHRWSCEVELKSANSSAIERARNCLQRCPSVPWVCCIQAQSVQEAFSMELPVINVILSISCPLTHSQFSGDSNISCRCSAESSEFAGCCPLFEDQALLKAIASGDKELQLELLEWAGAVHAQCCSLMVGDGDGRSGLVVTSHRPCKLYQIRLEGLLAPCAINSVVTSLVDAVSTSVVPWVLLSLFGHEDSPSAWKNTQHSGALNGGECHVSVLLFRNSASQVMAVVFESVGASDSRV